MPRCDSDLFLSFTVMPLTNYLSGTQEVIESTLGTCCIRCRISSINLSSCRHELLHCEVCAKSSQEASPSEGLGQAEQTKLHAKSIKKQHGGAQAA